MAKYKQKIVPVIYSPSRWKGIKLTQLRREVLAIAKSYTGRSCVNEDTGIIIHFSNTNAKKVSMGSAVYFKKAAAMLHLLELLTVAEYNNFGERKATDNPEVIGFLNFKAKCIIDGQVEHVRIAIQFCRGDKFFYNMEINKIELLPKKSRR